jgi:hypothetical protein
VNDEIAMFNDAVATLRAHAVLLESVARVVEGPDPWPVDLVQWIAAESTTTNPVQLGGAFRDAAREAEKSAGYIVGLLRDRNAEDAMITLITAASSIDMLLEHRVHLGGKGCATLPSATEVMAVVKARYYKLFPVDETEFYTPQVNAFIQWLATHPNPWA